MVDTRWLFTGLVALVGVERLVELKVSRRHQRLLVSRGAIEVGAELYPWMVILHSLFLVSCLVEVWWLGRLFHPVLAAITLLVLVASLALRYWVVATLGHRWTTRVFCPPGEPVITGGPYRYLHHPNYLAVAMEILALPLVHTAWLTAVAFSAANGLLLERRIRSEEEGLRRYNDFAEQFQRAPPGGAAEP